MSIFDGIKSRIRSQILALLLDTGGGDYGDHAERVKVYDKLRDYKTGEHTAQMRVRAGQPDDNIVLNFCSLIIDRSISLLFGSSIEFKFPGTRTTRDEEGNKVVIKSQQAELIEATWKANKKGILLHKIAYFGSLYGTVYVRFFADGLPHPDIPEQNVVRLILMRPHRMTIIPDDEDMEKVIAYVCQFEYLGYDAGGRPMTIQRKEIIERTKAEPEQEPEESDIIMPGSEPTKPQETWTVSNYIASKETAGKFVLMRPPVIWPFEFPPILHWQNLPDPESCYGVSDLNDVIGPQDRLNFVNGNVSKIIRYYAHPMRWSKGVSTQNTIEVGADKMLNVTGQDASINAIEMSGDLGSSRSFALDLRQAMFDISRTIDISSLADRLGTLTNFGLRVLFMDALAKLGTKQKLYGDALQELNHRLLRIAGNDGAAANGGEIVWPDPLPQDTDREAVAHVQLVGAGIESVPTAQQELGLDPDDEQEKMSNTAASQQNVGELLLQNFTRGK